MLVKFTETESGLIVDNSPTIDELLAQAEKYVETQRVTPIYIGDLLNAAEDLYGEAWSQLTVLWPEKMFDTIRGYKYVCDAVPYRVRPKDKRLRINQMDAVRTLNLKPEIQKEILTIAVQDDLGYDDIKATFADSFDDQETTKNKSPSMGTINSQVLPDAWEELYNLVLRAAEKLLSLTQGSRRERLQIAVSALQDARGE